MPRKQGSVLTAVISVFLIACVSLAIVGGIVAWMAAREGTSAGELLTEMLGRRQSARPVLAEITPFPTRTPYPTPTPTSTFTATPTPEEPLVVVEPVLVATSTPQPGEPPATSTPPPQTIVPAPTATSAQRIEPAISSPIRSGSPLPERPVTRLVIPAMGLDIPVTISPIVNQTWRVDHLGKDFVGHLEGTASPGSPSNVVLAGHVTIAHNVYGPFAGLGQLQPGDPVILYESNQPYTYIVDYRQLVDRTDVDVAYPSNTGRVTLITCSNWSDDLGAYQQRLIVVGHLAGGGS